jgi:hypothetical protein
MQVKRSNPAVLDIQNDNCTSSIAEHEDDRRLRQISAEECQKSPIWYSLEGLYYRSTNNQTRHMLLHRRQRGACSTFKKIPTKISCILLCLSLSLFLPHMQFMGGMLVLAGNYNGYYYNYYNNNNANGNDNANNNNYYGNNGYYNDDTGATSANDDGNNANDDGGNNNAAATDDGNANQQDDAAADAGNDDLVQEESYAAAQQQDDYSDVVDDATAVSSGDDNAYLNEDASYQQSYKYSDDDVFHWNENVGFSGVSILPLSCVN